MWRAIRTAAVASASCVPYVTSVPAFAQSDSAARPSVALERTSLGAAREYVPAEFVEAPRRTLPPNLLVPDVYRPLLQSMLRQSPTFARQCARIANSPQLTVTVEFATISGSRAAPPARAHARIMRHGARLNATIVIAQTTDVVELVAHEIEHVIEQLDGVNLPSKAQVPESGVRAIDRDAGVFETIRAHRIGLRVAEEHRRPRPGSTRLGW